MDKPSLNLVALSRNPDGSYPVQVNGQSSDPRNRESFFKSVQWSADGTALFASSSANRICTFVLPETLLEPREEPTRLKAQGTLVLGESTSAIAPCPYFALENPSTQVILTASNDHPIHLHYAFPQPLSSDGSDTTPTSSPTQPPPLSSFRLIKHETEAYLPITSLIWPAPGTHFIAGTTNRIAIYDVSRPDAMKSEPLLTIATIPSTRHLSKGNGIGMRGTVSALAAQVREQGDAGLVAAGTWTRHLGLYDLQRAGACVATWGIADAAVEAGVGGRGVMQIVWSPCGRYLVVNERGASGLLVYDLRGTNKLLAHLTGRDGDTNQRLSCDVFPGIESVGGFEVWAGMKNGGVAVWEGVGNQEGAAAPSWDWKAHESSIGSTAMHMSGSVLATCSGSWKLADDDDGTATTDSSDESSSEESEADSGSETSSSGSSSGSSSASSSSSFNSPFIVEETSLKIWSIGPGKPLDTNSSIEYAEKPER
ncbi:WD40-repeat-containing domain protein [Lasiosphaeris hirsuta]|uniref:WD40-repeat-containing domain protein n=1 Tax=Lasiosphaeris hirsuta TaxID=260670 RepID=A0AA40AGS2_9PEZI|nr:WD40-repeat-containing domain protein [Lasiosphaeris hirsuta]